MRSRVYLTCSEALLKDASVKIRQDRALFRELRRAVPKGVTVITDTKDEQLKIYGGLYGQARHLRDAIETKMPTGEVIVLSRDDPTMLAHESGHAEFERSTTGKALQSRFVRSLASLLTPVGAIAGGYIAGPKLGPLGGALVGASVPFLINSPVLIGEAVASKKGVDRLRQAGMSEEDIAEAKIQLLKAYGTYALRPAMAAAAGAIVGAARGRS